VVQPRRADDSTRTSTGLPDPNSQPLDAVWDEEWRQALPDEAMQRLKGEVSTQHFQIFYLSVIKGHPAAKVAAALGVNMAKVYVVRHRLTPPFKKLVASLQKALG